MSLKAPPTALPRLLNKLLVDAAPASTGNTQIGGTGDASLDDSLLETCVGILQRPLSDNIVPDENVVAERIKKYLLRTTGSTERALQFTALHSQLKSQSHLERRWALLQFMLSLAESNTGPNEGSDFGTIQQGLVALGLTPHGQPQRTEPPRRFDHAPHSSRHNTHRSETHFQPSRPLMSSTRRLLEEEPSFYGVPESGLLRDMIYLFQGIDGKIVKLSEGGRLQFQENLPGPVKTLTMKLAELGRHYSEVVNFLATDVRDAGVMRQAFCSALNRELTEYYRLIAVLEAQTPAPDRRSYDPSADLTLKRLLVWTQEPLERMKTMNTLIQSCQYERGGALLSRLYQYADHGDPAMQKFIQKILAEVSRPFQDMLRKWIFEGELEDPCQEFFVATGDPENEDMWKTTFVIDKFMKPDFLSQELAEKILNIGKSLHFLRHSCKETDFVLAQSRQGLLDELDFANMTDFETAIDNSYFITNRHLMTSLFDKHKLEVHLEAMKRYFFMSQGDFVQHLLETTSHFLDQSSSELRKQIHHLTGMFDGALRSTNACDPEIVRKLDVMWLQNADNEDGWHTFTIKYDVEPPIHTVINKAALSTYQKIFNFLLQIKGVAHRLTEAWHDDASHSKTYWKRKEFAKERHRSSVTLSEMGHFIGQLQYYLMFEVLESAWTALLQRLARRGPDLDEIVNSHEAYLSDILLKSMLPGPIDKGQTAYQQKLELILQEISSYKRTHDRLIRWMEAEINQDRDAAEEEGSESTHQLFEIRAALSEHKRRFQVSVYALLRLLRNAHVESLRALADRLNFNDFYVPGAVDMLDFEGRD